MYDDFSDVNYSTEFMTEDVKFKLADVKKLEEARRSLFPGI